MEKTKVVEGEGREAVIGILQGVKIEDWMVPIFTVVIVSV